MRHSIYLTAMALPLGLLGVLSGPLFAQIIYVDDDAHGLNDGTTWTDAYRYLQDAVVDAETENDAPVEIRVAQGIYRAYEREGIEGHRGPFRLLTNVAIRGGYAGSASRYPDVRGFRLYRTVLIGDTLNNDTEVSEAILGRIPSREDNTRTIVKCAAVEETAILNGCIVQGGQYNSHQTIQIIKSIRFRNPTERSEEHRVTVVRTRTTLTLLSCTP